ncbi:hypothetical protein GCM10009821_27340 [Aeromicrobium halocynthiae]|uniref:DNA topoisomerase (ATP-hydrolyzing) n=1 Tax=Aeromicrobium halocynthiae TaxID=560557 RepID=A0ABN2W9E2_9ACTN
MATDAAEPGLPGLRTTHDWSSVLDEAHVVAVRDRAGRAPVDPTHLVLEVLAYAVDEALEGTGRHVWVELHDDGSVSVTDDGRGTDTRPDAAGQAVIKPVMATPDLRFHQQDDAPVLVDGEPRSGLSTVCAVSTWLEHVNRRATGAWMRRYEAGRPAVRTHPTGGPGRHDRHVRAVPPGPRPRGRSRRRGPPASPDAGAVSAGRRRRLMSAGSLSAAAGAPGRVGRSSGSAARSPGRRPRRW